MADQTPKMRNSGAKKPAFGDVLIRDRGRLPHWEMEGAVYFVTFRLNDSLPQQILNQIKLDRVNLLAEARKKGAKLTSSERQKLFKLFTERLDAMLDSNFGSCWMNTPAVADIVASAIQYFKNQRYRLFAWCVMPNHVHVVMRMLQQFTLKDTLHSWKSFTSKEANKLLERDGTFWQREYYDHIIRSEEEFRQIIRYILENPLKAQLKNWRWVGCE